MSNVTPIAVPVLELPRRTFLQKAREDLIACRQQVPTGGYRWCGTSRRAMVNLLNQAILQAEEKGYDDNLFVTYHDIDVMMRDWYFEDTLKSIFRTTLLEIERNIIERQRSVPEQLSEEKQILRESLDTVREAHEILQEALREKIKVMNILKEDNRKLRERNKELEQELATEKAISEGLRRELESRYHSVSETSSDESFSGPSSQNSGYNPCLFKRNAVRSSQSDRYRF